MSKRFEGHDINCALYDGLATCSCGRRNTTHAPPPPEGAAEMTEETTVTTELMCVHCDHPEIVHDTIGTFAKGECGLHRGDKSGATVPCPCPGFAAVAKPTSDAEIAVAIEQILTCQLTAWQAQSIAALITRLFGERSEAQSGRDHWSERAAELHDALDDKHVELESLRAAAVRAPGDEDFEQKLDWLVTVLLEAGRTKAGGWAGKDGMISFRELAQRTLRPIYSAACGERDSAQAKLSIARDALAYYARDDIYGVNGDLDYGALARKAITETEPT